MRLSALAFGAGAIEACGVAQPAIVTRETVNPAPGQASAEPVERFYLPQLDLLRFFAFSLVFIAHAPFHLRSLPEFVKANVASFGVDLFFALSAYLITSLLLRERRMRGEIDVRSFYIRRMLRIWPLYFSFLTFALAAYLWASARMPLPRIWLDFAGLYFLVGNFVYCLRGTPNVFMGPLWSVCVEEQFYLLWPLFVRRATRHGLVVCALVMLLIGETVRIESAIHGYGADFVWCNTFARLDPIAAGILLAIVPPDKVSNLAGRWRAALILVAIGCWLLASSQGYLSAVPITRIQAGLCYPAGTLGSIALLAACLGGTMTRGQARWLRWLSYLGRISYGLYVYHILAMLVVHVALMPTVAGLLTQAKMPGWAAWVPYLVLSMALTVLISAASYRWLEAPFLRMKRRFTYVPSRPV